MSLFQCQHCGCCENTALSCQGFRGWPEKSFDWSYAPERKGLLLCSACGPVQYAKGEGPTKFGVWHDQFERIFLPRGRFKTNDRGNLEHIDTGSEDIKMFAIRTLQ